LFLNANEEELDPYNFIHRLSRENRRKWRRGRNGRED
jgi:hypothetical protein